MICVMMVGSVFAMAISANAAPADDALSVGAASDVIEDGAVADPTYNNDVVGTDNNETVEPTIDDSTVVTETGSGETTVETSAATTAESIAPTATESTAPTTAATEAPATKDQGKKPSPKTGENAWLWIGIGIFGVALVALIITFVVKKKNAK